MVQLAGGNNAPPVTAANFNVDPETSQSVGAGREDGTCSRRCRLSAALFQIDKTNARTPGVNPGDPPVVLDGEQQVQGFEASGVGTITPGWNVIASYAYLDGEVTKSNRVRAWPAARRHARAFGDDLDQLRGQRRAAARRRRAACVEADQRHSPVRDRQHPIVAPSYTVFDAFAEYRFSDRIGLRVNVYNIGDKAISIPSPAASRFRLRRDRRR